MDDVTSIVIHDLEGLGKRNVVVGTNCGSLYEVKVCQRTCTAKRLFDVLHEVGGNTSVQGEEEVAILAQGFRRECVSLSKLRHPNVLQFIGVHCGPAGPLDVTLVTEHVYMELDQYLQSHPNVDISIKLSVLFDVSCGLLYLHTRDPPIVHRSLTASNVVLTRDLTGKIADLRVSKVFDLEAQVLRLPEVLIYMPPEVLARPPSCDVKMDVFSFGVLCLFVANQELPPAIHNEKFSPTNNGAWSLRRKRALDKMDKSNPLHPVISQCLLESGDMRPTAAELNRAIQGLSAQHQRRFKDIVKRIVELEGLPRRSRKQPKEKNDKMLSERDKDSTSKLCAALEQVLALKTENDKYKRELERDQNAAAAVEAQLTAVVRNEQMALERQRDEFWVKERQLCIELHSAQPYCLAKDGTKCADVGKPPHYEDVDGNMMREMWEQNKQLKMELRRLLDEGKAYQEQSKQQKEQIAFYATAANEIVQENARLKRELKQEVRRVEELLVEVDGLRKDAAEMSNAHQKERQKRSQLERKCIQLESLQALHKEDQVEEVNQSEETTIDLSAYKV